MALVLRSAVFIFPMLLLLTVSNVLGITALAATTTTSSSTVTVTASSSTTTTPTVEVMTPPPVDTSKALLSPTAQTRITNLAANVSNRLDATLRRLTNVHDRIQSRIEKTAALGVDTTTASIALGEANGHLTIAWTALQNIDRDVVAFIGSSNPKAGFLRLKATYTTIYSELKLAHSSLLLALRNVDGTITQTPESTTVSSTTSTE